MARIVIWTHFLYTILKIGQKTVWNRLEEVGESPVDSGNMAFTVSHSDNYCNLLWLMSTSPKHLLLKKIITWLSLPTSVWTQWIHKWVYRKVCCHGSINGVIPRDYIPDPQYISEYSCATLLFVSCGPRLRCKPCPDEITVTAINISRWEGSVSSLKITWRSMHNKLYTLEFPWNILFWSCKRWMKLCLCSINWNTRIPAVFHF